MTNQLSCYDLDELPFFKVDSNCKISFVFFNLIDKVSLRGEGKHLDRQISALNFHNLIKFVVKHNKAINVTLSIRNSYCFHP